MSVPGRLVSFVAAVAAICAFGCNGSSTNSAPAATTSPSPVVPPSQFALTVTSVSPSTGATVGAAEIRLTGTGFSQATTLTFGDAPAIVSSRSSSTTLVGITPAHAPGIVDLVVANPNGDRLTLPAAYTFTEDQFSVTVSPNIVAPGDRLTLSWNAPEGRGSLSGGDWIALFRVGDPDNTGATNGHSDLWYAHLRGAASGTLTLSAPIDRGEYEFRYMAGGTAVARSSAVTVTAVVAQFRIGLEGEPTAIVPRMAGRKR